jgi:hypothetical protein
VKISWLIVTAAMAHEAKEGHYSEDEIEEILGMGGPEAELALKQMRETIRENPLLFAALIFAFGILVGASLGRGHRRS